MAFKGSLGMDTDGIQGERTRAFGERERRQRKGRSRKGREGKGREGEGGGAGGGAHFADQS
jgi:hypothetical protein